MRYWPTISTYCTAVFNNYSLDISVTTPYIKEYLELNLQLLFPFVLK